MRTLILLLLLMLSSYWLQGQHAAEIDLLLWNGDAAQALVAIDEALQTAPAQPAAFMLQNKRAEALIRSGKYQEAQALLTTLRKQAEQRGQDAHIAALESNTGFLYIHLGRNDLALDALQTSMTHWEQAGALHTLEAAQTQSHLGNLFRTTGKYTQAEEQLSIALLTRQKQLPGNHALIAASYNDLGLVFSFRNPDKALGYYEKALALYQQLHTGDHPKIAIANTNIGYLYSQLELYGDAIHNFEKALGIWEKVYTSPHPSTGFVLFNLGQTYQKMKDHQTARLYYDRALKIYEACHSEKHPDIARVYNALGNLDLAENKFTEAMHYYHEALLANVADFSSGDIRHIPQTRHYYDGNVLLYSLLYKAQALEATYLKKSLRFQDLVLAIRTLHTCDTLIEKLRQQINNEHDKITLGTIAHEVYTDAVRICSEAAAVAWKKHPYYEKAFFFSEKSKAAVLLGALSEANAKSFAGIPITLLEEEKSLRSAIALCAQKLAQKPAQEEEHYLRETNYNLNRAYEAFSKRLEKDFPAYYNLKYNTTSPTIAQLQAKLDPTTMLISYFLDEKHHRLYTFRITQKRYDLQEQRLPEQFDRYITGLRNSLFFSEINTYTKAAETLSAVLVPRDIPPSIQNLVIIPTARLSTIPFETLFFRKPRANTGYQALPYLVNRYTIRYEFSGGLVLQKGGDDRKTPPSILLCAPVSFTPDQGLPALPGTETEVSHIASLFRQNNLSSTTLLHQRADEKRVKEGDLKQYAFVHFATHGMVDEQNPDLSRIFLQAASDAEDGNLYASEIYNLELDADLVTLSACETGLGKIAKGEGVIGLSRALVYAGAQNCIVSCWKVADESTALFMKDFYQLLLDDPSNNLTATLKKAKQRLIANERFAAPYYWAPFILIGF